MAKIVRLALALSLIMLVGLLAGTGIAAAEVQYPHAFYGSVQLYSLPDKSDLKPAPVGTVVTAKVDGEVKGQITVTEAGLYGGEAPGDPKLLVQDDICSSCVIEFYVNGQLAEEVRVQYDYPGGPWQDVDPEWEVEFNSGDIWGLDLIAYAPAEDGGGGGGGGTTGGEEEPGPPGGTPAAPAEETPTPTPAPPGPTPSGPTPPAGGGGIDWWVWLIIGIVAALLAGFLTRWVIVRRQ